jgi:hypothetical protein
MRRIGAGGVAALWLGLAVAAAAADPPAAKDRKESPGWWSGLFGGKPKDEPKPAAAPVKTVADKAAEEAMLRRAYLRRLAVCDRLRDVARDIDNAALYDEADRLQEIAWKLYTDQSSKLFGVASVGVTPDDPEAVEAPKSAGAALRQASPGGPLPPRLRSGMSPSTTPREGER